MTAVPKGSKWVARFEKFLVGEPNDLNEQRGYCPVHEDPELSKTPSASYNWNNETFYCFGGCGGMSLSRLFKVVKEEWPQLIGEAPDPAPRSARVRSIDDAPSKRKGAQPLPGDDEIHSWVERLLASPTVMATMIGKRGLTEATIEKYEIGWHQGRYTIPVRDADGVLVNVRRYKADAKQPKDKMTNLQGHGEARLFLPWVLRDEEEVVIAEGEMDAIVAQQHGLPAMTHTAGASVWKNHWSPLFKDKVVFICYDVDNAGFAGSAKVANSLLRYAKSVHIIRLPLTAKGSDITDYLVEQGYTADDFRALMDEARKSPYGKAHTSDRSATPPKRVTLENSMSAEHGNQTLEIVATVAGKMQPAYVLPKEVSLSCDMSFSAAKCANCPMSAYAGQHVERINKDDTFLLELIDKSTDVMEKSILRRVGAPTTCTIVEQETVEAWNVEELVVLPSVDNRDEQTQTPISRKVYNVGEYATPVNATSRIVGFNTADPKNQRALFQSWQCEPVKTNIDKFEMTEKVRKLLSLFVVPEGKTPLEKMGSIARDLEANVTRIYGRPALHMAYDLVWHSVMDFRFKGVQLGKGWLELLVMGDTRTGKSEAALRLTDHYNAGVLKSCEGATLAGLVGGAQQHGNSWMVTWGTIPLNDRRLVVLDEVSGMSDKSIIDQMSAVRSSGKAQITKIISQETSARTRLIWISNPPDGRAIREMGRGAIEAIQQLIKNPEDIARFDIAMSAASADVNSSVINNPNPPRVRHRYTAEACSALVSWAWSRKVDDIVFEDGVEDYVIERAEKVGHRFIADPPLIQPENFRVKLARVSVAVASRVFSTDEDCEQVIVKREHVDAAEQFVEMLYGMDSFGYMDHSRKVLRDRARAEANTRQARIYLVENEQVLGGLLACLGGDFKVRDFEEFAGMHKDEAQEAVRNLMMLRMLRRMTKGYIRMEPSLINILKELEDALDEA